MRPSHLGPEGSVRGSEVPRASWVWPVTSFLVHQSPGGCEGVGGHFPVVFRTSVCHDGNVTIGPFLAPSVTFDSSEGPATGTRAKAASGQAVWTPGLHTPNLGVIVGLVLGTTRNLSLGHCWPPTVTRSRCVRTNLSHPCRRRSRSLGLTSPSAVTFTQIPVSISTADCAVREHPTSSYMFSRIVFFKNK